MKLSNNPEYEAIAKEIHETARRRMNIPPRAYPLNAREWYEMVDVEYFESDNDRFEHTYTTVVIRVRAIGNGNVYEGVGHAKRNPKDKSNPVIGFKIAFNRAIHSDTYQIS